MRTVSPNAPQFPARVLRDLKDFKDLRDLRDLDSPSAQAFRLKAQKYPAQGKANNVSRHPGWTTSRMMRPTGAKAKNSPSAYAEEE